MKLANETIAATQQIAVCVRTRGWFGKQGTANGSVRRREISMRVRGFDRRSVNDEAEQQKGQRARKHATLPDQI